MKSLGTCPPEIQRSILGQLSRPELYFMCLVNKDFRFLAEPFLYSKISIKWQDKAYVSIKPLLRAIVSRPELGHHIRALYLRDYTGEAPPQCSMGFRKLRPLSPKEKAIRASRFDIDKATEFIKRTGVPNSDFWIARLEYLAEAHVSLLIAMSPNLRFFDLDGICVGEGIFGAMLKTAFCHEADLDSGLPRFQNLRQFSFPGNTKSIRRLDSKASTNLLSIFYSTQVEHICISVPNTEKFIWPAQTPNPPNLTSLELNRLREGSLKPLLSALKGLRKLQWNWFYLKGLDPSFSPNVADLDKIVSDLSCLSNTLTDLTITARATNGNYMGVRSVEMAIRGSLSGFQNMNKLKRLSLPWAFVMGLSPSSGLRGWDYLPASLEFLQLRDDFSFDSLKWREKSILSALQSWLENEIKLLPNLRVLKLHFTPPLYEFTVDWWTELEKATIQHSISVELGCRWGMEREDDFEEST